MATIRLRAITAVAASANDGRVGLRPLYDSIGSTTRGPCYDPSRRCHDPPTPADAGFDTVKARGGVTAASTAAVRMAAGRAYLRPVEASDCTNYGWPMMNTSSIGASAITLPAMPSMSS